MFNAESTAEQVCSEWGHLAKDKYVLVTGASSGIGAEAARVLARSGAHVWLAGRDIAKTDKVKEDIRSTLSDPSRVHSIHLDLSSIASVRACVKEFLALKVPIDILLNNAGCMAVKDRTLTENNLEMQIGTNHFGHFELTNGLAPAFRSGTRVVNVSSMAHRRSPVLFEDVHFERTPYDPWVSYGQSKSANILHAVGLQRRLGGAGVTAVSLHPGVIETELWRHTDSSFPANKTIPQGAATSVFCCLSPTVRGGAFYSDCAEATAAPFAVDVAHADALWDLSEQTLKSIV